jgi:transcriptional regulator with XRE-family HTH domain
MSRLERGVGNPSLDAIQTLADALGVEVVELFAAGANSGPETSSPQDKLG